MRLGRSVSRPEPPLTVMTVTRGEPRTVTTTWDPGLPEEQVERVPAQFFPLLVNYDRLGRFVAAVPQDDLDWPNKPFAEVALLLHMAISLVEYPPANRGMHTVGCMSYETDFLLEQFDPLFGNAHDAVSTILPGVALPKSVTELLEALSVRRGAVRPLRAGQIAHIDGDLTLIDLHAATAHLMYGLAITPTAGDVANVRASMFEEQVQQAIDETEWRPPESIQRLVGRTIEVDGRVLTDLDAIAIKGRTLLIVSVKSRVFSVALERGDFKAVRNASTMVEEACRAAADLSTFLRQNLRGTNYDFSEYDDVPVVVCTPYPVFVSLGATTREILPGLRAAVCLDELERFLGTAEAGTWTGPAPVLPDTRP